MKVDDAGRAKFKHVSRALRFHISYTFTFLCADSRQAVGNAMKIEAVCWPSDGLSRLRDVSWLWLIE
jgi:hypothetical protein